jgi:hypothetical protein
VRRTVPVVVVAAVLVSACSGSSERAKYVRANEKLFKELPRLPSAQLTRHYPSAYRGEGDSSPVLGYTSVYDFKLPARRSGASVGEFFTQHLRSRWLLFETVAGAGQLAGPMFNFRRANAEVSINLENARFHRFEIAVDHAYFGKLGRCGTPGGCSGSSAWVAISRAILACRAKTVSQTHSLAVSVTTTTGRMLTAKEPRIDAILDVLNAARCRHHPAFSTE